MTNNEIIEKWLDYGSGLILDYNVLHEAWVKFRDLEIKDDEIDMLHAIKCRRISDKIGFGTITEAFDRLVKGIEWYNSLNKQS